MNYTEAIKRALAGDDRGFTFLYEETFRSKYYLALQYMKNEDDAMDILQDAYLKAFAKLDTLQDPEKFPSWFGMIVANTAKNALVKKNPVLFTDMAEDPDAEPFEYSIEDEDLSRQPELACTREETVRLVREMMDALSEEQRICVLMFHIEGIPIREIAETLGCSENTVKSRLNYARKNIKKQGEELQKKGYQLYGIAPFTLLVLLLHRDASAMSGEAELISAGVKVEQAVFRNGSPFAGKAAGSAAARESAGTAAAGDAAGTGPVSPAASSVAGNAAAGNAAKTAAGAAVKSAFLSTIAGKITIGVIWAVLIGGAAFGVSQVVQNNQNRSTSAVVQEADGTGTLSSETVPETVEGIVVETKPEIETESDADTKSQVETESETGTESEADTETETESEPQTKTENESETETADETESEDRPALQTVSFDELPDLLEGNLTKEELEFMLAYTPEGYVSNRDSTGYYRYLYGFCWRDNSPLEILEFDGRSCYALSVDEVNRLISVITDFRLTEENDIDYDNYGSENVDGDIVWVTPCAFGYVATAEVYAAGVSDNYMAIAFSFHHYSGDADDSPDTFQEDVNENRIAILQKKEDGRFQIEYIGITDLVYLQYPDLEDLINAFVISIDNADISSLLLDRWLLC